MTKVVIDKEAEITKLEDMLANLTDDKDKQSVRFAINLLREFKEEGRTQGEWIEDSYAGIHCSECDYFPLKDVVIKIYADGSREKRGNWNLTPYCPNCGAYMGGGRE